MGVGRGTRQVFYGEVVLRKAKLGGRVGSPNPIKKIAQRVFLGTPDFHKTPWRLLFVSLDGDF